jgi:hypothetical protein
MIEFDYEPDHKYPYVCAAWCEVGGMNVGDRFTDEVGEALIDYLKDDVKITVNKPQETVDD